MTFLYSPEKLKRTERREKTGRALVWGLSFVFLAACVFFCLNTRMGNEREMMTAAVVLSVLGGWTVMGIAFFYWLPARAEYRHMQGILEGQEEEAEGVLRRTDSWFSIPRSVTVRRILLTQDGGELALQADAPLCRLLPPDGTRVRVRTVRRFITAWEAYDADGAEKNP